MIEGREDCYLSVIATSVRMTVVRDLAPSSIHDSSGLVTCSLGCKGLHKIKFKRKMYLAGTVN